jgi:hypothetical protein
MAIADRRPRLVAAIAIACALSTTGCFTLVGGVVGSLADSPSPPKRRPEPPPQLRGLPPGSPYFTEGYGKMWREPEPQGMSGGAKGLLVGLAIDATLVTLLAIAISNMDFGWSCGGDSSC